MAKGANQAQAGPTGPKQAHKAPLPSCSRPAEAPPPLIHRRRTISAARELRRRAETQETRPADLGPRAGPDPGRAVPSAPPGRRLLASSRLRRRSSSHPARGSHAAAPDRRLAEVHRAAKGPPLPRRTAGRSTTPRFLHRAAANGRASSPSSSTPSRPRHGAVEGCQTWILLTRQRTTPSCWAIFLRQRNRLRSNPD
nr:uncharacterized protein LOC127315558 [Lolium perenne]